MATCNICKNGLGKIHQVREMMFGFRDVFEYFECSGCGCLQLINPPGPTRGRYNKAGSATEWRIRHSGKRFLDCPFAVTSSRVFSEICGRTL